VLVHFNFAIKHNQDLGKETLKLFKKGGISSMSPFFLALMLSLGGIHSRMEEKIFDALKAAVINTFKDLEIQGKASWASGSSSFLTHIYDTQSSLIVGESRI